MELLAKMLGARPNARAPRIDVHAQNKVIKTRLWYYYSAATEVNIGN